MYFEELLIITITVIGIYLYRKSRAPGIIQFTKEIINMFYDKFAPYSYEVVSEKAKELGQEYDKKTYKKQLTLVAIFSIIISYLYFYNILITIIYTLLATSLVPYIAYLRFNRIYSEFIFEQIQVYTSNVIMEFSNTKSFVKALENVKESKILEDPILSDVDQMIKISYEKGTIEEAINYMNELYPYYIVKNTHQLLLQITKESTKNSAEILENMQIDIDVLIENNHRDKIKKSLFQKNFIQYGLALYLLIMLVQYVIGKDTYVILLDKWYIQLLLHSVLIMNTYFLIKGEKYYNENVGAK